jgi:predicted  nucleic acid-binding Zn-ribbon protein
METEMERLAKLEERAKSNSHRLDAVEKRQDSLDELVSAVATVKTEQGHIQDDVKEIKDDVKELTGKPAKRWEGVVDKLILAIVAAVAAYLLGRLGLG